MSYRNIIRASLTALVALLMCARAGAQPNRLSPQGGTITGVTAGAGMTGGGLGGIVVLNVICEGGGGIVCNTDSIELDNTAVPFGSGTYGFIPIWTPDGNHLGNSPLSYNFIDTVTSTAHAFVISAVAGLAPSFVMGQTGQTTWQFYEPASLNTFHLWNSTQGDVAVWTTDDLTLSDDLRVNGFETVVDGFAVLPSGNVPTALNTATRPLATVVQTNAMSGNATGLAVIRASAGSEGGVMSFYHTRNADASVPTAVIDQDILGSIDWQGATDATTISRGAYIRGFVNGAVSAGVMPTELRFATTTTSGPTVRMTIEPDGDLVVLNNLTLGTTPSNGHTINGSTVFQGTAWASIINWTGDVNQPYYARAGQTAGAIYIGDVNTGGVNIANASNLTTIGGNLAAAKNLYSTADNTYLSWDYSGDRFGFTKKAGSYGKATYGSANEWCIAQSSGTSIAASNTFTNRFCVRSNGTVDLGDDSLGYYVLDGAGTGGIIPKWLDGNTLVNTAFPIVESSSTAMTIGDNDADSFQHRGGVMIKMGGVDTEAVLTFENDVSTWRAGVDGTNGDSFEITENGVAKWLQIAKTTGSSTFLGDVWAASNAGAGTAGVVRVGQDTASATNTRVGYSLTTYSNGSIYVDHKVYANSGINYRYGDGATVGSTNGWFTLDTNGTDNTLFFTNMTFGTSTSNNHIANGNFRAVETTGTTIASLDSSGAALIAYDDTAFAAGVGGGIALWGKYDSVPNVATGAGIKAMKTNGTSGNYSFDLVFATRPNGGNLTEHMRIADTGATTISQTTNASLTLQSTSAFSAPKTMGTLAFSALNSGSTQTVEAQIVGTQTDYSGGSQDGQIDLQIRSADAMTQVFQSTSNPTTSVISNTVGSSVTNLNYIYGFTTVHKAVGTVFGGVPDLALSDTTATAQGVGGSVQFYGAYTGSTVTTGAEIKAFKSDAVGGNFGFDLAFATRTNGGGMIEAMRIKESVSSAPGNVGIGTSSPGAKLDISSTTQLIERLRLSGQEFYQAGNTSTNGPTLLVGVNRTNNRQLWIADSASLTQNTTNPVIRFLVGAGSTPDISTFATDGATSLNLSLQSTAGNVGVNMSTSAPQAQFQVNPAPADIGSYSFSNWNSTGSKTPAAFRTTVNNGGWGADADWSGNFSGPFKPTEPALTLMRAGVTGEAYANLVEFKVGRAQNNFISTGGTSGGVEARTRLDIAMTYGNGDLSGKNALSLISGGGLNTYTLNAPSFKDLTNVAANGMLSSVGGDTSGTLANVADIAASGIRTRNFVRGSDALYAAGDGTNGYFYIVNYGSTITYTTKLDQVSPRGVLEPVGHIVCSAASCSADFRTTMNYPYAHTGIKDVRSRTFTFSFWAKRASGTGSIAIQAAKDDDNDQFMASACDINATTWTRCVTTGSTNATSRTDNSELRFYLLMQSGAATTGVYLYGAQVEEGGQVTPYVRTGNHDNFYVDDVDPLLLGVGGLAYSPLNGVGGVYARQPGSVGNGYTITFSTGGPAGGTFTDGRASTYSYQSGVTTWADFCNDVSTSAFIQCAYTSATTITGTGTYTLSGAEDAHYSWTHRAGFGGDADSPWVIMNPGHTDQTIGWGLPNNYEAQAAMRVGMESWGFHSIPLVGYVTPGTDIRNFLPSADRPSAPVDNTSGIPSLEVFGLSSFTGYLGAYNADEGLTFEVYQNPTINHASVVMTQFTQDGTHGSANRTGTAVRIDAISDDNAQTNSKNVALTLNAQNADTNVALAVENGSVDLGGSLDVGGRLIIDTGDPPSPLASQLLIQNAGTTHFSVLSYAADNVGIGFDVDYNTSWFARDTSVALLYKQSDHFTIYGATGQTPGGTIAGFGNYFDIDLINNVTSISGRTDIASPTTTPYSLNVGGRIASTVANGQSAGIYIRQASQAAWMLYNPGTVTELRLWNENLGDIGAWSYTTGNQTITYDLTVSGDEVFLNNGTKNWIYYAAAGVSAPTFTTRSAGTKIVFYPQVDASNVDYAMGINGSTLWSSVPQANGSFAFRWYGGTTNVATMLGSGDFSFIGSGTYGDSTSDVHTMNGSLRNDLTDIVNFSSMPSTWDSKYSIFGVNADSSTGAALALGYSSTVDSSAIVSYKPGTGWKDMNFGASNFYFNINNSVVPLSMTSTLATFAVNTQINSTLNIRNPITVTSSNTVGHIFLGRQVITADGTYTPTAGTRKVLIRIVGGGGGGGGADNNAAGGGGGGAGVYLEKWIDPGAAITSGTACPGAVSADVGAAGGGGSNTGGAGSTGSDTCISIQSTAYTAKGGTGGGGMASAGTTHAIGGGRQTGSTAGANFYAGGNGGPGVFISGSFAYSGDGGSNPLGYGGTGQTAGSAAGIVGLGYGAGGGGAVSNSTSGNTGGNGTDGVIIIDEYY